MKFNDGMKLYNKGIKEQSLDIFDVMAIVCLFFCLAGFLSWWWLLFFMLLKLGIFIVIWMYLKVT